MEALLEVVRKTWGYSSLRPLQRKAMRASLEGRDALVVLPTGGGKSLCYQAPALLGGGLTVVVSPLISLMKDQVDRLAARGVGAASPNSSLEFPERDRVLAAAVRGECRFLFVAPERFAAEGFERTLRTARVRAFAIDEAHCISHWGHDFRAEYRALGRLKRSFPGAKATSAKPPEGPRGSQFPQPPIKRVLLRFPPPLPDAAPKASRRAFLPSPISPFPTPGRGYNSRQRAV